MRVVVTRTIPDDGLRLLREAGLTLHINGEDRPMSRDELSEAVHTADGVICLLSDRIDRDILDVASKTVGFANYAVGYENIDTVYATELGIMIANTPGVLTDATADLTWALLLASARRIVAGDAMVRTGRFAGWGPMLMLGADIAGRTLGIVGAGRIGTEVARRARGFSMRILYAERCDRPEMERLGARCVDLNTLLMESDFVTLHVPLTEQTHHLIDSEALGLMKPSAILINTSRGSVVDEEALIEALKSGVIAGAGLDVFEREPALAPGLDELSNVVLTPHIGSATTTTRATMATLASTNLLAMLSGHAPPNLVNAEVMGRHRRVREV
ncbi:D-glycerate dehydrogenase [Candidatus Fermentibacteria bacterium]|nr:D-glycerate dehydrogenase [Candidatus Fermentibacteria bacterium]